MYFSEKYTEAKLLSIHKNILATTGLTKKTMKIEEFTTSLIESIQENESGTTRRKYKSILHSFGYKRGSERIAKIIADSLAENGIITDREINSNLSTNVWITFSLQNKSKNQENSKKEKIIIFYSCVFFNKIANVSI